MTPRISRLTSLVLTALVVGVACAEAQTVAGRPSNQPTATGTKWVVDPVHSQINFRVRHLVGRVQGTFVDWCGIIVTTDQDWTHGTVKVTAQTASLTTGNAYRDADLRSSRFFAVDSFPQLTFEGTGIVATDSTVELGGTLTIKGHARHVVLTGQYRGVALDPDGRQRIAFDASTHINRRDFGITWTDFVGANTAIGDEVEITIAIEAVRIS
jgi:polyisoprenoid-binding protein YceI